MAAPLSILCIASYHKGQEFLREAKRQGARVYLVTSESLRDAEWPRDSLDDIFFVKDDDKRWKLDDLILGRQPPGAPRADRPHRAARRLRSREGVGAARAPPRAGHGRDDHPLLPRQAGDAAARRRSRRARCRRSCTCSTRRGSAPSAPRCRRRGCSSRGSRPAPSASRRCASEAELWPLIDALGRSRVVPPARAVRARRRLPRRQRGLRARGAGGGGQPLRPSALRRVARRRRLHHPAGRARRRRRPRAAGRQPRRADRARAGARRVAHRVHPRRRRPVVLPRDVGPRRRRAHRGAGRGGHRHEPVGRVGQGGAGRRQMPPTRLPPLRADYAGLVTSLARQEWPDLSEFADPEVVWRLPSGTTPA